MIRVIGGKRYNTETATLVAEWENRYSRTDFQHEEADLYRAPNGGWFLRGSGGPMTRWAIPVGNNGWGGGGGIEALTEDEAFDWLERHEFTGALEKFFSDRLEDA
jgi:hypothetical protein